MSPMSAPSLRIPGAMTPIQKRRRDVLCTLLGAVGVTFFMALIGGSMVLWLLWGLTVVALGTYCYLLVQIKQRARARQQAVPPVARPRQRPAPTTHPSYEAPRFGDNVIVLRRSVG
jgi:hypothetical protein